MIPTTCSAKKNNNYAKTVIQDTKYATSDVQELVNIRYPCLCEKQVITLKTVMRYLQWKIVMEKNLIQQLKTFLSKLPAMEKIVTQATYIKRIIGILKQFYSKMAI